MDIVRRQEEAADTMVVEIPTVVASRMAAIVEEDARSNWQLAIGN